MSYIDNKNNDVIVDNVRNNPVVPHAPPPETSFVGGQCFPSGSGVIEGGDFSEEFSYSSLLCGPQFFERFDRPRGKLNLPGRTQPLSHPSFGEDCRGHFDLTEECEATLAERIQLEVFPST